MIRWVVATVTQADGLGWQRAATLWRKTDGSRVVQVQRTRVLKASKTRTLRGFQGERPDGIGHQLQVSDAGDTACLNGKLCHPRDAEPQRVK